MSRFDQALVIPKSLEQVAEARKDIIAKVTQAYLIFESAGEDLQKEGIHGLPWEAMPRMSLKDALRRIDGDFWYMMFDRTRMYQIMDAEAKALFRKSVSENPPEFTLESVTEQFLTLSQSASAMFMRGAVNVFRGLSDHKTNTDEPFKVNQKCILRNVFTGYLGWPMVAHSNYSGCGADLIDDIDRIIKTLDGKLYQARTLEMAVNAAFKERRDSQAVYEDDYYKVRGYKNGNGHIWFKRQDLLDELNKMIGKYYNDSALAERRKAA